jgi:uncharacterized protein YndB with AHSA1/START domain
LQAQAERVRGPEVEGVPNIEAQRTIAADPTSGVLLLAAPAAVELWPGLSLVSADAGDYTRVSAETLDDPVLVRTLPPQRTPTGFAIRFTFSVPGEGAASGELTLTHAPTDDGEPGATAARLLVKVDDESSALARLITGGATEFLENLAAAAEGRSRAA